MLNRIEWTQTSINEVVQALIYLRKEVSQESVLKKTLKKKDTKTLKKKDTTWAVSFFILELKIRFSCRCCCLCNDPTRNQIWGWLVRKNPKNRCPCSSQILFPSPPDSPIEHPRDTILRRSFQNQRRGEKSKLYFRPPQYLSKWRSVRLPNWKWGESACTY